MCSPCESILGIIYTHSFFSFFFFFLSLLWGLCQFVPTQHTEVHTAEIRFFQKDLLNVIPLITLQSLNWPLC